jgi:hypothetical protein
MLVHFRQRIGEEQVNRINKRTVEMAEEESAEKKSKKVKKEQIKGN